MGRPSNGYYTAAGERVPSVTEVLSKFQDAGGLVNWAFKRGKEAGWNSAKGLPAPRSANEERDQAAQSGTIAHDLFECYLLNCEYKYDGKQPAAGVKERAYNAFAQAREWYSTSGLVVMDTEKTLVSEKYKFGGTRDAKLLNQKSGGYRIGDWKSSNAIHANYLLQVAAYGLLAEECDGDVIEGYDIVRFSKEHADWEHRYFSDLNEAKNAFLLLVQCYPLIMKLEDRV